METGWVMRLARELPQAYVLSSVPYFHVDNGSQQTFAQAYDADRHAAARRRAGGKRDAASLVREPDRRRADGTARRRAARVVHRRQSEPVVAALSTSGGSALGQQPLSNQQIQTLWARGDGGKSDYHAFYATLRRRMSEGLTFSASYTLSKTLDQAGVRQNIVSAPSSAFDLDIDWGPADTDRRHMLQRDRRVRPAVRQERRRAVGAHRRLVCGRHLHGDERHPSQRVSADGRLRRRPRRSRAASAPSQPVGT